MKGQLEREPQKLHQQSGRVQPKITYQWEKFHKIIRELVPLFIKHWEEIIQDKEKEPLDIDFEAYGRLDLSGALQIFTCRKDDILIGYIFFILSPNLNSRKIINAGASMYYLEKEDRRGWVGYKLFKNALPDLKNVYKANSVYIHEHNLNGILFKRIGFESLEKVFKKRL